MNEQAWKDIEEYALGQDGVITGSAHNTAGLQDRPKPRPSYTPVPAPVKRKSKKVSKPQATAAKPSKTKSSENSTLATLFFFIGFAVSCYFINQNNVQEPFAYIIGGATGGLLSAALHKVIIGIGFLMVCLYVFAAIGG